MEGLGRTLVLAGLGLAALGALVWGLGSVKGLPFGRLPGDVSIRREGFSFYFPITSMLLLSAVVSVILMLVGRWRR